MQRTLYTPSYEFHSEKVTIPLGNYSTQASDGRQSTLAKGWDTASLNPCTCAHPIFQNCASA